MQAQLRPLVRASFKNGQAQGIGEGLAVGRAPAWITRLPLFERMSVRRMWGKQGIVRLWPDAEVERTLSIGEGIESCLSGHLLRGGPPAWAALDASGVASLPVLTEIEHLLIFTDNDKSETGQRKAAECKARWEAEGRFVVLEMPPETGSDFNDFLISLKRENAA